MARTEEEDERNRCNTARSSKNAAFLRKKKLDSTSREPFRIDSRSWSVITKKDRRKIRGSFIFYVLGEGACGAAFSRAAFKVFLFFFWSPVPQKATHTHTPGLRLSSRNGSFHWPHCRYGSHTHAQRAGHARNSFHLGSLHSKKRTSS